MPKLQIRTNSTKVCLSIVIFSCLFALSCSTQKSLIGKWAAANKSETMEFFKDGTLSAEARGMKLGGKYTFVSDDRIKIDFAGAGALAGPVTAKIVISGDELTMIDANDRATKYVRTD